MSEWRESTIGELPLKIGDGNYSSKYPTAKEFIDSGVPFISNKDIKNGRIDGTGLRYISPGKHSELKKGHLRTNDILVSTRANIGDIALVDKAFDDANINAQLVFLRCDEVIIHSKFLYHLLSSKVYHDIFQSHASGSAQMQLPLAALREIPIIYPEINEQKAIASVLSSLDDKIDLLHRQNTTLEAMAETLFRQWFVEEAQDDWAEYKISDFADHLKQGVNPAQNPFVEYHHYSLPAFDENQRPVFEVGSEILSNKYRVLENAILVSKLNPRFPRIWPIQKLPSTNAVCSTEFQVFKPKQDNLYAYLYFLFGSSQTRDALEMAASGTSGSHQRVRPEDMLNITTQLPSIAKAVEFAEITQPSIDKVTANRKQIQTLEKLRDTLLPKLMSGEIRVNNLNLELL